MNILTRHPGFGRMKMFLLFCVAIDVAYIIAVAIGGGRPQANAHPAIRSGGAICEWGDS